MRSLTLIYWRIEKIEDLLFVNNKVIISDTERNLQQNLHNLNKELKNTNIKLNLFKTKSIKYTKSTLKGRTSACKEIRLSMNCNRRKWKTAEHKKEIVDRIRRLGNKSCKPALLEQRNEDHNNQK